jgi:hypothetical protein
MRPRGRPCSRGRMVASALTRLVLPQVTSKRTLQCAQVTDAPTAIVRSSVRKRPRDNPGKSALGWPESYFMFMVHLIQRHHWSMSKGGICIQRKQMRTRLGRWHNLFGRTNGTKNYLKTPLELASSFISYTNFNTRIQGRGRH